MYLDHLHKIESGDNKGNYVAVLQHGKLEIEQDGETQVVDVYEDKFIVGANRFHDFKSGHDKGDGWIYEWQKLAVESGASPSLNFGDVAKHHIKKILADPLSIIEGALSTYIGLAKPKVGNIKGNRSGAALIESYYRDYTPPKGTKINPLKGKEIRIRFKQRP